MKKIFRHAMTVVLAAMAFTSCSNSKYEYDGAGEWNANDGYAQVSFTKTSLTVEKEPSAPTQTVIELTRTNTVGSATVNFEIETNTDDVFTVSPAVFADGAETANAVVSFPKAEVGKTYTLKLLISDPAMVSQYSADNSCVLKVTRIQWNLLGTGNFADNFWYEDENPVEIYQRDDKPTQYRVMKPFGIMAPAAYGGAYYDGTDSEYVTIDILQKDDEFRGVTITESDLVNFSAISTGFLHPSYGQTIWLYHPSSFTKYSEEKNWEHNKVLSYQSDGTPEQIQLAPYYYMDGVGGWDNSQADEIVMITFPGYTPPYNVNIAKEFTYGEQLFAGMFTSEKLGTSQDGIALCIGNKIDEVEAAHEGCYERFAAQYGTPYCIVSPYAEGYNLYFAVNADGKIVIPEDVTDQPIGLDAMGDDIYAHINGGASTFGESEVVLNITFQNEDGSIIYGETNETLANIKWNLVGTGTYSYFVLYYDLDGDGNKIPYQDPGYEIYQREDKPNTYKVPNWCDGGDFIFTWNQKTNNCTVPLSFTGFVHPEIGQVYVGDVPTFYYELKGQTISYANYPCTYDPETKTFSFTLYYLTLDGYGWNPNVETLQVEWGTPSAAAKRASSKKANKHSAKAPVKKFSNVKSRFVGKKVASKKSTKSFLPTSGTMLFAE